MTAAHDGPLHGLRVLETGTGVACPYAGRLFAMLGAEVVKAEPRGGDPARDQPVDHRRVPPGRPSPLFAHLNAEKRLVTAAAVDTEQLVRWSDVVLDDRIRAGVAGHPLDPERLAALARRPVVARVTAWGFDADCPGELADELIVQAASGLMAITAEQHGRPVRFPGWQSQYLAGGYAAAAALAALGGGNHEVDVSWVAAASTAVEAGLATYLHSESQERIDGVDPPPQRALQDGAFPSGPFRCADGHVVPGTVRPADWALQCKLYDRVDLVDDERFGWRQRWSNREALRSEIQPWYDERRKAEIFTAALEAGWAAAMVVTATDALGDPHLSERRFLSRLDGALQGRVAGRPWRAPGVPEAEPVALESEGQSDAEVTELAAAERGKTAVGPPDLNDLRVLELTWAWAGPFVGRFLGSLGADVVRIETGSRPDGWRVPVRWKHTGLAIPAGAGPDDRTFDAAALFNSVNRNKRGVSIDLTVPEGLSAFVALLSAADVLVVNMTATVLADRGVEDAVTAAVDRGLVAVTLPALGASGPFLAMPGYGTLTEGMGGFGARFGPPDQGAGISTTYYPDCVAGLHATVAVLSALARRESTGEGSFVDLSQQETMWLQLGEDLVLASTEGRDPQRLGNAEPASAASGVFESVDGTWLAVVASGDISQLPGDGSAAALGNWVADRDAVVAERELRSLGFGVRRVVDFDSGYHGGVFEQRGLLDEVEHPVTGRRAYLGVPVRLDGEPARTRRPAPRFAEHTEEVLGEWAGVSADELDRWRRSEGIGTVPAAHVPGEA